MTQLLSRMIFRFSRPARVEHIGVAFAHCLVLLLIVMVSVLLISACGGSGDENSPLVVTETVNGTVKVTTTGP
jgi:hypothetical protein